MQYQEKKVGAGFEYYGAGVFGEMTLNSPVQLDGDKLDGIMSILMKQKSTAQEVSGEVLVPHGTEEEVISYHFKKTLPWGDEAVKPKEEPCENTHTETKRLARWCTAILHVPARIYNWCKRFVEAFREEK
jgi:hypothetical protein